MSWRMNPEEFCSEEGCIRPRAVGSDMCLACQQGCGIIHRRLAEREESPAMLIDLENWPVLPED
ncbi:MAG TPA: hypothetical protein VG295_13300 [Solirubrobacteraceae bacterium]|nr:hypothetical protein [Solirubrobacteraceae bacterium]